MKDRKLIIGLDFGTDSVRGIIIDALSGEIVSSHTSRYPRWAEGLWCDPSVGQFRQHPMDIIECMEEVVSKLVLDTPDAYEHVLAIGIDTTGSTPCLCDYSLTPLSLLPEYRDNASAMFFLWKDHSSAAESDAVERICAGHSYPYLTLSGGRHSPESYWSKVSRALKECKFPDGLIWGAIEMHDWLPALLCGIHSPDELRESRPTAAAKHLWCPQWGGFPTEQFFRELDPALIPICRRRSNVTYTPDTAAGVLCQEWASRFGLSRNVIVGVGLLDSWCGAVGSSVSEGNVVMSLGTSAAYVAVMPEGAVTHPIDGILCQVEDLVIPGMTGFETGLSSFGDAYAWFGRLLDRAAGTGDSILSRLTEEASGIVPSMNMPLATDWFNGRRTPDTNMNATASIVGLNLSTTPAELFYAIVEATAFATRRVMDLFVNNGIRVGHLTAIGGIPQKSDFVMQMMSDVLDRPLDVSSDALASARGAAMFASVNAQVYPDVQAAQHALCRPYARHFEPRKNWQGIIGQRYEKYLELCSFTDKRFLR